MCNCTSPSHHLIGEMIPGSANGASHDVQLHIGETTSQSSPRRIPRAISRGRSASVLNALEHSSSFSPSRKRSTTMPAKPGNDRLCLADGAVLLIVRKLNDVAT